MVVFVVCFSLPPPFFSPPSIVAPAVCIAELVGGHEEGRHVWGQVDGPQRNGIERSGSPHRWVADADSQEGMGG